MNQQSLEDLLAFIALRNVTKAAQRRNISQPAYSRRLQSIETQHSMKLLDRSKRPAVPTPALDMMKEEIEAALASIKKISRGLSRGSKIDHTLSIAAIHSLSSSSLPIAIGMIADQLAQHRVRIRSANQDICFQLLMTEEVSLMLAYETPDLPLQAPPDLVKKTAIKTDKLLPVCTPRLAGQITKMVAGVDAVPLVAYPNGIFLGELLYNNILARSPHIFTYRLVAGLTNTVMSSALTGLGLAWLPYSVIKDEIRSGELVIVEDSNFPNVELTVSMLQLRTKNKQKLEGIWTALAGAISETIEHQ